MVGTRSLSSGAHSRDPLALPTGCEYISDLILRSGVFAASRRMRSKSQHSLKRHVETFRDVGAEAGGDDDAAAHLLRVVVAGPHRVTAGPKKRIGVRRLGFGGVERVVGIGLEDAWLLGAAAVGLDVDDFLVVPRQRQADRASEIFRGLDVEDVGVGSAGRGIELSGAEAAAAGNSLVVAELEVVGM